MIYFPLIVFVFLLLIGLILGSFLNCLIWRLHQAESLGGRSYCPKCRHQINWYDNIPLLSFAILGGRCRHCRKKISWQYPLVEFFTAIILTIIFLKDFSEPQLTLLLIRDWLLALGLITIFVYDLRWQMVPMLVVWPLIALMFIANLLLGVPLVSLIFSALIGTLFFLAQYIITKKRGVGEGDIWLGALLGLTFPSGAALLLLLIVSYGLGSLTGLFLMIIGQKGWKSKIALGPFLAFGAIITLIWGKAIINWYFQLF
jgi:prepilin signal peptidase PulO-like enzyme (type II secretory pathway)